MLTLEYLFKKIDEHFLTEQSLHRIRGFIKNQCQCEGWFKGELIHLLSNEKINFKTEAKLKNINLNNKCRKKIDFEIELNSNNNLLLELKSFYHGLQKGTPISLATCFSLGVGNDIKKLIEVDGAMNKFIIIFITPKPKKHIWENTFNEFCNKVQDVDLILENNYCSYPEEIFIAKVGVNKI